VRILCRRKHAGGEAVPAQAAQTVRDVRPAGWLRGDPPAGAQYVAGDRQLVRGVCGQGRRRAGQGVRVDELAIDPQRVAGIGDCMHSIHHSPTSV